MVSDLLFSLREVEIKFGKKVIFQDLNLNLHMGDMIALVGKNGVGKTTLMKTIYGDQDLDAGELWNYPGLKVGYFNQKFEKLDNKTIEENFSDLLLQGRQGVDHQSPAYHGCVAFAGDSPWSGFTSSPSESSSKGFRDDAAPTLSSSGSGGLYLSR